MNDAFAADTADTLPFTGLTPYGRPSWSGLLQFSLVGIPLKAPGGHVGFGLDLQ